MENELCFPQVITCAIAGSDGTLAVSRAEDHEQADDEVCWTLHSCRAALPPPAVAAASVLRVHG
eukprot:11182006-Lingulodinium_polyedra.AAC.1